MKLLDILHSSLEPCRNLASSSKRIALYIMTILFLIVAFSPVDNDFYEVNRYEKAGAFIHFTEDYMRFAPTVAQVILPLIARDPIGFMQMISMSIATTLSTQSLKRILNQQYTFDGGRRLGQRPRGDYVTSKFNMPSGHSSMVACATFFLIRRYGIASLRHKLFALGLILVMVCTMYSRVMLDAHTIMATIAGALVGFISVFCFVSPRPRGSPPR